MKLLPFGGSFIYNIPPLVELMASFPVPEKEARQELAISVVSTPYQIQVKVPLPGW